MHRIKKLQAGGTASDPSSWWLKENLSGNTNLNLIGKATGMVSSLLPDANNNDLSNSLNQGMNAASDVLMSIPTPLTQIIGGGMKGLDLANKGLASITNGATTINNAATKADEIMSSNLLALTPIGLANSLGKSKIKGSNKDLGSRINYGYQATDAINKSEVGGLTNMFQNIFKGKKNSTKTKRENRAKVVDTENALKFNAINQNNKTLQSSINSVTDISSKNRNQLFNLNNSRVLAAKKGVKLSHLKNIINKVENKPTDVKLVLQKLKSGGKVNVIPDGALHSRKNNLDVKGVTKKGIPVITKDGKTIDQHAEIEKDEIIFHKSLTNELEKKLEQYESTKDDKILIEVGKLLTFEILDNTEDNTGLIQKV